MRLRRIVVIIRKLFLHVAATYSVQKRNLPCLRFCYCTVYIMFLFEDSVEKIAFYLKFLLVTGSCYRVIGTVISIVCQSCSNGLALCVFPQINQWPYIAIIDPRTGENMVTWTHVEADGFPELITEFLSLHPTLDSPAREPPR